MLAHPALHGGADGLGLIQRTKRDADGAALAIGHVERAAAIAAEPAHGLGRGSIAPRRPLGDAKALRRHLHPWQRRGTARLAAFTAEADIRDIAGFIVQAVGDGTAEATAGEMYRHG